MVDLLPQANHRTGIRTGTAADLAYTGPLAVLTLQGCNDHVRCQLLSRAPHHIAAIGTTQALEIAGFCQRKMCIRDSTLAAWDLSPCC